MSAKAESPTLPLPPPRVAHVRVPYAVAFDLEKSQAVVAEIMRLSGHPGCCSGIQILFNLEERFIANEAGEVRAAGF